MTIQAHAACPWSSSKFDMWSSIQEDAKTASRDTVLVVDLPPKPYVHPMMRRSASTLSQNSLEVCTESLGSETGSDGCLSDDCFSCPSSPGYTPAGSVVAAAQDEELEERCEYEEEDEEEEEVEQEEEADDQVAKKELRSVNYHCSTGRRSLTRSFPPPLPSISRRDGPCVQMRSHRRDGRLVLKAVSVPSQNYLHCTRSGGRLLLTFIEPTFEHVYPAAAAAAAADSYEEEQIEEEEDVRLSDEEMTELGDEEETYNTGVQSEYLSDDEFDSINGSEEEVEVVDRGIVVEVKVSRQAQPLSGGMKVRRSSLVINKFIGGVDDEGDRLEACLVEAAEVGRTAAAAAAIATVTEKMEEEDPSNKIMAQDQHGQPFVTHVPQPQRCSTTEWSTLKGTAEASISSGTAAAAAAAAEEVVGGWGSGGVRGRHVCPAPSQDNNSMLLRLTSKKPMNRQMLLHQVRRCGSDPQRPLFITEPCCVAIN